MMPMTKHEELVWLAAFFDGEGCVMIARNTQPSKVGGLDQRTYDFRLQVQVSQVDPAPLRLYQERWNGTINCKQGRFLRHRDCSHWIATGINAYNALVLMRPYLIVKAEQVDVAIEFQDCRKKGRTTLLERMRRQERDEAFRMKLKALKRVEYA